jgi:hypothetical protein
MKSTSTRHLLSTLLLLGVAWASADAQAQEITLRRDKDVTVMEGRDIRGVAVGELAGSVFGADRQNNVIYRWRGLRSAPDGSAQTSVAQIPAGENLADLGWANSLGTLYAGRGNRVEAYDMSYTLFESFDFGQAVGGVAVNGETLDRNTQIYVTNPTGSLGRVYERRVESITGVDFIKSVNAAGSRIVHGMAYDMANDRLWVNDDDRKLLTAYDGVLGATQGGTVTQVVVPQTFPTNFELYDMEFSNELGLFYMCLGAQRRVLVYNRQGQQVEEFTVGVGNPGMDFCAGLAAHGDEIWVSNRDANVEVYRRRGPNSYERTAQYTLTGGTGACNGASGDHGADSTLAFDPLSNALWRWAWQAGGFCAFDPNDGTFVAGPFFDQVGVDAVGANFFGHALSYAGGLLIEGTESNVGDAADGFRIWRPLRDVNYVPIRENNFGPIGRHGLAFDHQRNRLWASTFDEQTGTPSALLLLSPSNFARLGSYPNPLTAAPWGSGLSYSENRLYAGTSNAAPDPAPRVRPRIATTTAPRPRTPTKPTTTTTPRAMSATTTTTTTASPTTALILTATPTMGRATQARPSATTIAP